MPSNSIWCLLIYVWSRAVITAAEKDSTYWPPGKHNPNVKRDTYYNDAINVLQDIDRFDKIYVRYHNCAYSAFGDVDNLNSGGYLESDAYWYMGYTQTYRANAAFSLYGVLKGYRDHGCKKATFINSFFTRYGAQTFVQALQLNGYLGGYRGSERDHQDIYADYSFTSVCHRELSDDDGGYSDNATTPPYMNDFAHPNSISYTLGCSSDLTFEIQSFLGARCVLGRFSGVYDELKEQNEDLGELGCALLYDSGSTPYNYNQQQDWDYDYTIDDYFESDSSNGGYDVDEENLAIVPEIVHPLDLIKYSQSCSIAFSAVSCPDPYGLVKSYYVKLSRATRLEVVNSNTDILKRNAAWILMVMFGVIMILFSFTLNKNDGMISKMPRRDYKIDLIDFEPPSYTRTLKKIGVFLENLICGVIEFIVSVFELDVGEEEEAEKSHATETAKTAKDVDSETGSAIDSVSSESESSDNSASFESKKSMLEGAKVNSVLENPQTQGTKRIGSANFEIPAVIGGSMVRCLSVVSTGTANSSVQVDSVKSHDDDIDNDRRKSASVVGAWKPDFLSISRSGSNMVAAALSTSSHGRADAGSGGTQDVRGLGCAPILNTESQAGLEVELTPPHYLCATTTTREVDASKCPITSTSTRPRPSASTNKPPLAKGSTTASGKPPRAMRKKPPSPAVKSITTTPITRSRSQSAPSNTASRTAPNEDHESSAHPPNTRATNEPSTVEQDIGTGTTTEASQQPAAATEKPEEEKKQNEKGEWGGLIQCQTDGIIVQYPVKTDAAASEKHEEEKQNEKGEWGGLINRIIHVKTDEPPPTRKEKAFKRMMQRRFSGQNKK